MIEFPKIFSSDSNPEGSASNGDSESSDSGAGAVASGGFANLGGFCIPTILAIIGLVINVIVSLVKIVKKSSKRGLRCLLLLLSICIGMAMIYGYYTLCSNGLHGWAWGIWVLKIVIGLTLVMQLNLNLSTDPNQPDSDSEVSTRGTPVYAEHDYEFVNHNSLATTTQSEYQKHSPSDVYQYQIDQ